MHTFDFEIDEVMAAVHILRVNLIKIKNHTLNRLSLFIRTRLRAGRQAFDLLASSCVDTVHETMNITYSSIDQRSVCTVALSMHTWCQQIGLTTYCMSTRHMQACKSCQTVNAWVIDPLPLVTMHRPSKQLYQVQYSSTYVVIRLPVLSNLTSGVIAINRDLFDFENPTTVQQHAYKLVYDTVYLINKLIIKQLYAAHQRGRSRQAAAIIMLSCAAHTIYTSTTC